MLLLNTITPAKLLPVCKIPVVPFKVVLFVCDGSVGAIFTNVAGLTENFGPGEVVLLVLVRENWLKHEHSVTPLVELHEGTSPQTALVNISVQLSLPSQ